MKVLVIPKDFRKDQYILRPIFERLCDSLGWANTKVVVCMAPLLQGVNEALKEDRLRDVIERYPMMDLFVLCVDRDGVLARRRRLDELEIALSSRQRFIAVNAWEELETWILAALDVPKEWSWAAIRAEISVKERYFEPLARQRGVSDGPGGGRKALGEEASRRLPVIRRKCPEDFGLLASRFALIANPR